MQIIDTTGIAGPSLVTGTRPDGDLMDAHRQWARRPKDHWCMDVEAMLAKCRDDHERSQEGSPMDPKVLRVESTGDGLVLRNTASGGSAGFTHLGFSQIANKLGAPAAYLRTLPPDVVADALNAGLKARGDGLDRNELVPLWTRKRASEIAAGTPSAMLRCVSTTKYARVWNLGLARKLEDYMARNPGWGAAEAFRTAQGQAARAWGEKTALPLAFVGEGEFFAFVVNYERPVEIGGTTLVPGFFLKNSETVTGSIEGVFFFFDFACSNMIVWGAKNVRTVKIRHVGDAERRALFETGELQGELRAQAHASVGDRVESIRRAQRTLVADTKDDVIATLREKFDVTKRDAEAAYTVAETTPRYGDPRSVWGVVQGLTEVSQREEHASERIAKDRQAGKILDKFVF